jgi:HdeA/HdeB family
VNRKFGVAIMQRVQSLLIVGALVAPFSVSASAEDAQRSVEQYKCKDIMRETGSNREVAIAFLHGYLLGKSGGQKFDVQILSKQSDAFTELCLDNPNESAAAAMAKAKS